MIQTWEFLQLSSCVVCMRAMRRSSLSLLGVRNQLMPNLLIATAPSNQFLVNPARSHESSEDVGENGKASLEKLHRER